MSSSTRCVVFDLDDTLYLERNYVRSGFQAVGQFLEERFELDRFYSVAWAEFEAGRRGDIFDRTFVKLGGQPEECSIEDLVTIYREHEPSIQLEADARECLEGLGGQVSLALITDGPLASQKAKARVLGVDRWIEHLIFTAELGPDRGKPNPRAFERVEELFGIRGEACTYVADNPLKDFAGPSSLGWRTVRIRREKGLYSKELSGPDVDVVTDLLNVDSVLG